MKNWTETVECYLREGRTVSGGKQGKTGQQKTDEGRATADFNKGNQLTDTAQGTLGQFEGPVNQSPFYKAMLTTGIEGTSQAYDNARTNMKAKANAAGFGNAQPVSQGVDNQIDAQEAGAMADVPRQALLSAAPLSMQAAGQTGSMGMGYGSQGSGYDQQAGTLEMQRKSFLDRLNQVGQFVGNVGGGIAGAGMGISKMRP